MRSKADRSGAGRLPRYSSNVGIRPAALPEVSLDRLLVPDLGIVRVLAGRPQCSPLVQQVPALVQRDLELLHTLPVGFGGLTLGFLLQESMLLMSQLVDAVDDALVVHWAIT